jgi:hypothetical protein
MAICIGCSFSCDWSEYYSFFVALTESGWEALGILLYNIYLVAGTVIFITAALPILVSYVMLVIFGFMGTILSPILRHYFPD